MATKKPTNKHTTVVYHNGTVIALAMNDAKKLVYTIPDLAKNGRDLSGDSGIAWPAKPGILPLPTKTQRTGYGTEVGAATNSAKTTSDEPFQLLSDGSELFLFRQSGDNCLLFDRYTLAGKTLNLKKADEPTRKLDFVRNLRDGRFSVQLLPTQVANVQRWQIFTHNTKTDRIDSFNIERRPDGLFKIGSSRGALAFDGSTGSVELQPQSIPTGKKITVSFWAYGGNSLPKDNSVIQALDASGKVVVNIHLPWSDSVIPFDCGNNGGQADRISKAAKPDEYKGSWTHWAFTKDADAGEMKIYRNGALWHSDTNKTHPLPETKSVRLGSYANGTNGYAGRVDELRIWNIVRSAEQIKADMSRRLTGKESGLVGYWRFDKTLAKTLDDLTNNNKNATIHGASWTDPAPIADAQPAHARSSLTFDGSNDYVHCGNKLAIANNDFSVEFWAKRGAIGNASHYTVGQGTSNTANNALHIGFRNDLFTFDFNGGNALNTEPSYTDTGGWHHWCCVYRHSDKKRIIYYDGAQVAEDTAKAAFQGSGDLWIGKSLSGNFFNGQLDDVRIWKSVRTESDIAANMYRRLVGNESGLVGYWRFDEDTGTRVYDLTTNANHGTVHGKAAWDTSAPVGDLQTVYKGASLAFDGKKNYVELQPGSIPTGKKITVSFWAYGGNSLPKDNSVIQAVDARGGWILNIHLPWSDSVIPFDCGHSGGQADRIYKVAKPEEYKGTWSHWAFTKDADAGEMKIYRNGALWQIGSGKTHPLPTTTSVRLGSYANGTNGYDGRLDELRIWNIARTEQQIKADMSRRLTGNESGLVGYWRFDEGSGNSLDDLTANNKNATIHGATWAQPASVGKTESVYVGSALAFDGKDDYINCGDKISLVNSDFSIEFWAKRSAIGSNQYIINQGTWGTANSSLQIGYPSSNGFTLAFYGDNLNTARTYAETGKWHHWCCVYRHSDKKRIIYRNGEVVAEDTAKAAFQGTGELWIGKRSGGDAFQGQLDEVRIWKRVRTQDEIRANMVRRLNGSESGLAGYWPFNEGKGTTVRDLTTHKNNGTVHGGAAQSTAVSKPAAQSTVRYKWSPFQGSCLVFDGKSSYVELPPQSIPTGKKITISVWAYGGSSFPKNSRLLDTSDGSGARVLTLSVPWGNGYVWFEINLGSKSRRYGGAGKQAKPDEYKGSWTHWAFTKDEENSGEVVIYRNGLQWARVSGVLSSSPAVKVLLGCDVYDKDRFYDGRLAELRIWNIVRTEQQIKADMNRRLNGNESGLVGYWPMNEGNGTTLTDKSPYKRHGTIRSATWGSFQVAQASANISAQTVQAIGSQFQGACLAFDGKRSYVDLPPQSVPTGKKITVSFWAYGGSSLPKATTILDARDANDYRPLFIYITWGGGSNETVGFISWYDDGSSASAGKNVKPEEYKGSWAHWAFTTDVDAKEMKIYRNGLLFGKGSVRRPMWSAVRVRLGGWNSSKNPTYPANFEGRLAELRIWNIVRTEQQIRADMNRRLKGNESGLVGYWPMDEGKGTILHDKSPYKRHGTIYGGVWERLEEVSASSRWVTSAPIEDPPGMTRNSITVKDRTIVEGMSTLLYPPSPEKPLTDAATIDSWRQNARALLTISTAQAGATGDAAKQRQVAALDLAVARDGLPAQLPSVVDPKSVLKRGAAKDVVHLQAGYPGANGYSNLPPRFTETQKLQALDRQSSDYFGFAVAIDGSWAIVGAQFEDTGGAEAGAVYFYHLEEGQWVQKQKILASDKEAMDNFGCAVALHGEWALVGARLEDTGGSNAGSAYLFKLEKGQWSQKQKVQASDRQASDQFGCAVALHGQWAVVGALAEDTGGTDAGAAYLFKLEKGQWGRELSGQRVENHIVRAEDRQQGDKFGSSVDLHGEWAFIGAPNEDGTNAADAGAAYLFKLEKNRWTQKQKIVAGSRKASDHFGSAVALHSEWALVGAYQEDTGGTSAGAAYLFQLKNDEWGKKVGSNWVESQKIQAKDKKANAEFGNAVALCGTWALIGAQAEDTRGTNSGAAYLFSLESGQWEEKQKIQPSDIQASDNFGNALALSHEWALISAPSEDTGGSETGSAYLFDAGLTPRLLHVSPPGLTVQGGLVEA